MVFAFSLIHSLSAVAQDFAAPWLVNPIGGDRGSYAGGFVLGGAAGDPAAAETMSGGEFALNAGAWAIFNEVSPACPGDLTGDDVVDLSDLAIVLLNFGVELLPPWEGDIDGDGQVQLQDLSILLVNFGNSCK